MNKKVIKPIVLFLVFIGALFTFNIITEKANEDLTTSMSEASLPVMHFYNGDMAINELHGYVKEMNIKEMRDSITPIGSDRKIRMSVSTYGETVDGISYEIRSMDGQRLIAEAEVAEYSSSDNVIDADLTMQNILTENTEYMLVFKLNVEDRNVYYYTRLIQRDNEKTKQILDFAKEFHDNTFKLEGKSFFPTYMDAATGDATTLNYVDLTCTLKQIMWADFKAEPYTEPVVSFKEINDSYDVLTLSYVLSNKNENGETEYYNVEEYFRLRLTETRMYVLNYERTMNQIFSGENSFVSGNSDILLGIRDKGVEYKTNESGETVCFVQQGELWCVDTNNNDITRVFSFRNLEGIDSRENWDQHDIKIVRIDEAGSVDFIVYGYMNRGEHEGEVGTAVFHYDGLAHTVEEEAFIPADSSYEVLKAEMGQLMYENDQRVLYLLLEGNVYKIDLNTLEVEIVIENLEAGCYTASASNRFFAWVDAENQYSSNSISFMDLKDGKVSQISSAENNFCRPLGFLNEDFVYGVAASSEVVSDAAGNTTFPMYELNIIDSVTQQNLKKYSPQDQRVSDIVVEDYTIKVNLMNGGSDSIMNKEADAEQVAVVKTVATDIKQTQVLLSMKKSMDAKKMKMITSKSVIVEENRVVELKGEDTERFYVYVKGDVLLATDSISDAMKMANDKLGVVVDSNQQYVWRRARKNYVNAFNGIKPNDMDAGSSAVVKCISAMLEYEGQSKSVNEFIAAGQSAKQILQNNLEDCVVLDLKGVSVEEIIFYVSEGSPVFAMTGTDTAVLVIGYSATNIYYYEPLNDSVVSVTYDEANTMFANGNYQYLTFLVR